MIDPVMGGGFAGSMGPWAWLAPRRELEPAQKLPCSSSLHSSLLGAQQLPRGAGVQRGPWRDGQAAEGQSGKSLCCLPNWGASAALRGS